MSTQIDTYKKELGKDSTTTGNEATKRGNKKGTERKGKRFNSKTVVATAKIIEDSRKPKYIINDSLLSCALLFTIWDSAQKNCPLFFAQSSSSPCA